VQLVTKETLPLVSVGIPTYNRPEGLKAALECFAGQSYTNLEIIISDNCSQLDISEVIESYLRVDDRVKYFRQSENIGMTLNSHFVWNKATGKYFILGSDDDWWDKDFVYNLVKLLEEQKDAVCAFCDFNEIDTSGKKIRTLSRFAKIRDFFGLRLHFYPDHYPLLKSFSKGNVLLRLENYILQKEFLGKANVHRALCDREVFLKSVDKLYELGMAECWGFDMLLAFTILTHGKLALSKKLLFKCTAGNQKNYIDIRSRLEYLDGYIKVVNDAFDNKTAKFLTDSTLTRFLDRSVGFYQEYMSLLKQFVVQVCKDNNSRSLKYLNEVNSLVRENRHSLAVAKIRQFVFGRDISKLDSLFWNFKAFLPILRNKHFQISIDLLREINRKSNVSK